jgi:hypothetical protein
MAGLQHLPHDHVVNLVWRHAGLLQGASDGNASEVGRRQVFEAAQQPPDRRPGSRDNDRSSHQALLVDAEVRRAATAANFTEALFDGERPS